MRTDSDARTALLLLAAAVLLCTACAPAPPGPPAVSSSSAPATTGAALPVVARVIDGDTLVLTDGRHVRLLGVDAPEKGRCWHDEATTALATLTPPGTTVTVTGDPTQAALDRYGRTLAYVDSPATGDASENLARQGAARTYVYGRRPVARDSAYEQAQAAAQADGVGLWGACGVFPTG